MFYHDRRAQCGAFKSLGSSGRSFDHSQHNTSGLLIGFSQIDQHAAETLHTLPIPWKQDQDAYQLRYVFGYAMDGSILPCYILWPVRSPEQSFWCIDAWKGDWVRLDRCDHMAPLGIEHFFDAFCFEAKRPWRTAACQALRIPSCRVAEDTHLEQLNETTFSLSP